MNSDYSDHICPYWTVDSECDGEIIVESLNNLWESIIKDYQKLDLSNINDFVSRAYDIFGDSMIREQLFYRICNHYDVDYEEVYNSWLFYG